MMIAQPSMTIPEAAEVIGLTGRTSLNGIHARFHELVQEWHPDISEHDPDLSYTIFIRIKEAYDILIEHGMNYHSKQMISGKVRIMIPKNSGWRILVMTPYRAE